MPSAGSTLSASITMEQKSPPPQGCLGGWSTADGKELLELKGHSDEVTCIDFSPDGSRVMTGAGDNTARLWNAAKGGDSLKILQHDSRVNCVRFNSDGTRVVTGGTDNIGRSPVHPGISLRTQANRPVHPRRPHRGDNHCGLVSPDNSRIVTGSTSDFTTHAPACFGTPGPLHRTATPDATLEGPSSPTRSPTHRPRRIRPRDGKRIVTGSRDRTRPASGKLRRGTSGGGGTTRRRLEPNDLDPHATIQPGWFLEPQATAWMTTAGRLRTSFGGTMGCPFSQPIPVKPAHRFHHPISAPGKAPALPPLREHLPDMDDFRSFQTPDCSSGCSLLVLERETLAAEL